MMSCASCLISSKKGFGPNNMKQIPEVLPSLNIHALLRQYGLRPKKKLGQNFLIDDAALRKIVKAAEISPEEVILEIGPGLGSLTRYLAVSGSRVIAVELDHILIAPLKDVMAPYRNVTIVEGDILGQNISQMFAALQDANIASYAVIANIPYYITSALIRHLLEASIKPDRIVLTVQNEVAMRICADPPKMSLLALSVQIYGEPKIVAKIPAAAFYPAPQIDSAVIRIDLYPIPIIPDPLTKPFFQLAKAGFSQKRKNLRNSISGGLGWDKAQTEILLERSGINHTRRAETLNLDEWHKLATVYTEMEAESG